MQICLAHILVSSHQLQHRLPLSSLPSSAATEMMNRENLTMNEQQSVFRRLVFRGEHHMGGNCESPESDSLADHSQQSDVCLDSDDLVKDFLKCLNKGRSDRNVQHHWLRERILQASLPILDSAF